MGGFGSGRSGWRPTVEGTGALGLDAAAVVRAANAAPRVPYADLPPQLWTWTRDGEPRAEVEVSLRLGAARGTARLRFDIEHLTRRTGRQDQQVGLEATPCRFGGQRWWWLCPTTGRRCAKLYLPNGARRFLSRPAHGLAYASQSEDPIDRAHRRAARVHMRLGSPVRQAGANEEEPPRPKGMRRRTYKRLLAELRDAEDAFEDAFLAGALRVLGWPQG